MVTAYLQGMAMGGGLIVAIGAQNAFVFSQAVRRNNALLVALLCSLCDAVLIGVGVTGIGAAVAANPVLGRWSAWLGALFLFWYGLGALRSALRGGCLEDEARVLVTARATVMATLAITLLNPHVYLDTVVLLGAVSGQYAQDARYVFGAGAATASVLWFFTLALGGGMMAPLFRSRGAWRVLDGVVCATMWGIGMRLALHGMSL